MICSDAGRFSSCHVCLIDYDAVGGPIVVMQGSMRAMRAMSRLGTRGMATEQQRKCENSVRNPALKCLGWSHDLRGSNSFREKSSNSTYFQLFAPKSLMGREQPVCLIHARLRRVSVSLLVILFPLLYNFFSDLIKFLQFLYKFFVPD